MIQFSAHNIDPTKVVLEYQDYPPTNPDGGGAFTLAKITTGLAVAPEVQILLYIPYLSRLSHLRP